MEKSYLSGNPHYFGFPTIKFIKKYADLFNMSEEEAAASILTPKEYEIWSQEKQSRSIDDNLGSVNRRVGRVEDLMERGIQV